MDNSVADITIKIGGKALDAEMLDNLVNFKVNASIGTTSVAKIIFFDDAAVLQGNSSFDIGKSIDILIGSEAKAKSVFKGDITRIDYIFSAGEADKIQMICYDGLHRLSKIWHSRAFVKSKLSDIASKMAGEAKLTNNKIDTTTKTYEHLYQNNQSNLDFLRMHAKQIGYEVDIEGSGLVFKKARYKSDKSSSIVLEWGEDLVEFTAKVDSSEILSEVVVSSWDSNKKENVEASVKAGSESKIGGAKKMGTKEVKSKLKSEAKVYRIDIPNLTQSEAKEIATSHLTMASMNYLKAEGICKGEPKFALGQSLEIKGVGDKISGKYYISSYEHMYSTKGFKTSFEIQTNGTFK